MSKVSSPRKPLESTLDLDLIVISLIIHTHCLLSSYDSWFYSSDQDVTILVLISSFR